jgi:hypothetical protein
MTKEQFDNASKLQYEMNSIKKTAGSLLEVEQVLSIPVLPGYDYTPFRDLIEEFKQKVQAYSYEPHD